VHNVKVEQKNSFCQTHARRSFTDWWESYNEALGLGGDPPPVTKKEVFKDLLKSQFYPIKYEEDQRI